MKRWKEANIWSKLKRAGGEIVARRGADAKLSTRATATASRPTGGVTVTFSGSVVKKARLLDSAPTSAPVIALVLLQTEEDKDDSKPRDRGV